MLSMIASLQTENTALKDGVTFLEQCLDQQEWRENEAAQYSRWNCMRISGLKEADDEILDDVIVDFARELQADVNLSDIDNMHCLNKRRGSTQSQASVTRPRDIIIAHLLSYEEKTFN